VEDNQMVRNLVKDVLESAGYEVRVAGNGHEAITLLAGHFGRIHLLLTDLMMPEMDGRALAQRVKVSYPTMKILLTSGYVGDGVGFHKELGEGVAFIQKPYAVEALADKVREVLDA
jgi:CheY-like chemotaxis protein